MHRVLVTGSSGSIGTRVAAKLHALGMQTVLVDKDKSRWLKKVAQDTIHVDLTDERAVHTLPTNVRCIVHLAAHARIKDLIDHPLLARDNVTMTMHLLEFARAHGISKVIFASSREVYGEKERPTWTEDCVDVAWCASPYAFSKIACEALIEAYSRCYGIEFVTLRFSNVYGRYDTHNRIVPLIIAKTMRNEPITIFGATKTLDFCYIDDAATSVCSAITHFESLKNEAYNIGSGVGTKLTDLTSLIHAYMGKQVPVRVMGNRVGDMQHFVANITKAQRAFGFSPQTNLENGIARAVAWYTHVFTDQPSLLPR